MKCEFAPMKCAGKTPGDHLILGIWYVSRCTYRGEFELCKAPSKTCSQSRTSMRKSRAERCAPECVYVARAASK